MLDLEVIYLPRIKRTLPRHFSAVRKQTTHIYTTTPTKYVGLINLHGKVSMKSIYNTKCLIDYRSLAYEENVFNIWLTAPNSIHRQSKAYLNKLHMFACLICMDFIIFHAHLKMQDLNI